MAAADQGQLDLGRRLRLLFLFDLILLIVGAANVGLAYGASTRSTLVPSILIL